ncbi:hypothetical protein MMP66_13070 [Acinetobacter dispersus]|uniref:hypothetical protein n=1 Tax=Acinetobacter dispersus TaxID=70348 RepID=UPI001F4B8A1A|nr:hypothetical protein [Acinetobacter dispersus]MCH7395192.1 hypothetical protein [Acinetobacter dispersus]
MNKKILSIGIIVTAIWIVIILSIFLFTSLDHPKSLNEFGDFLAGVFAPIAFFWLILGYMQQGKQLEQNTKALEQQEIALQLQIDEMKENVKQQKEIALINEKTLQASYEKERPYISYYAPSAFKHSDDHYVLVLNVYNMGKGDCYNLQATLIDGLSERPFLNFLKVRAATAISLSSFKHSFFGRI